MVRSKSSERVEGRARRRGILPAEHAAWSAAITDRVLISTQFRQAHHIACYAHDRDEVRTDPLACEAIRQGKLVFYPRIDPARRRLAFFRVTDVGGLQIGYRGIREPLPVGRILQSSPTDLILVPGVAFDLRGRRLGRGGGYYDRWLATAKGFRMALAYECQLRGEITQESHDQCVDSIVTEQRVIACAEVRL